MTLLKNWAASNPNLADPRIELGRLYQEYGQTQVAERYLDEALTLNPQDYRAWNAKAQMREAAGEFSQALQNYQQSLAINAMQHDLYQRVASLNVKIAQGTMSGGAPGGGWTVQNQPANAIQRY